MRRQEVDKKRNICMWTQCVLWEKFPSSPAFEVERACGRLREEEEKEAGGGGRGGKK